MFPGGLDPAIFEVAVRLALVASPVSPEPPVFSQKIPNLATGLWAVRRRVLRPAICAGLRGPTTCPVPSGPATFLKIPDLGPIGQTSRPPVNGFLEPIGLEAANLVALWFEAVLPALIYLADASLLPPRGTPVYPEPVPPAPFFRERGFEKCTDLAIAPGAPCPAISLGVLDLAIFQVPVFLEPSFPVPKSPATPLSD